jgi:hypothetical protein
LEYYPPDHAELDLAVAGEAVFEAVLEAVFEAVLEAVFEAVLRTCHPDFHLIHGLRMLWVF